MRREKLQNTELELSCICYGTANFGEKLTKEEAFLILDAFYEGGGNFIDTANIYCRWVPGLTNSSEQYIGEWLKTRNAYNHMVVATKGGHFELRLPVVSRINKEEIKKDIDESLLTLGIDTIDFYWLHRDNPHMEIAEIIDIMEEFVKEGKIRYYGASNYSEQRMEEALHYAKQKGVQGFNAVSNQWSMASVNPGANGNPDQTLVIMDDSYYQWHKKTKMTMIPYSSSANGFFQKMEQGLFISDSVKAAYENERNFKIYQDLCKIKEQTGISVYTLSIAWLLNQPFQVFPVASVSKIEQLKDFLAAGEILKDISFGDYGVD